MSIIKEKDFPNKFIHEVEVKAFFKRTSKQTEVFKFLREHFKTKAGVTVNILQEKLIIPDHARAYHLLNSLVRLKLLEKQEHQYVREHIYVQTNISMWDMLDKEVNK